MSATLAPLGWLGIVRLGLVQTALGAIVVLTTSTLNRVMVVELALPAMVPGALVGLHYALQLMRPRWGFGSDLSRRRTPWIVGGMTVLAAGGFLAAVATAWMATQPAAGLALAVGAFVLIGIGVGASGTSLLLLLAGRVAPDRRGPAATIVWVMMIAGFVVTAASAGHALDPFTPERLVTVSGIVSALALAVTLLAVRGIEGDAPLPTPAASGEPKPSFRTTLAEVWAEPEARRFTIFVFVSMLAYSAQDLILEPFAGTVFGLTPGQSTQLGGMQHGGVLVGMAIVGLATMRGGERRSLRLFVIGGCLASALALGALAVAGTVGPTFPLGAAVFVLGVANGGFAVAAISAMMALAGSEGGGRSGTRMGLWGAAQAVAFGVGGFLGAAAVDIARLLLGSPLAAYSTVFAAEAVAFVVAAALAAYAVRSGPPVAAPSREPAASAAFAKAAEGRTP